MGTGGLVVYHFREFTVLF